MVNLLYKSEFFLGLINGLVDSTSESTLIEKNIPVYIRKLNCFMACLLKEVKNDSEEKYILPHVINKNKDWQTVRNQFRKMEGIEKTVFCEIEHNKCFYYSFPFEGYGRLILGRKIAFENAVKYELIPVIGFFGKSLLQATQREMQKEWEMKLSRERNLFRAIIDNVPIQIYAKDLNYRKILSNKAELNYLGLKNESEVIGKRDDDFLSKAHISSSFLEDKAVLESGKIIFNKETETCNFKNEKSWALISKIPFKDENGKIDGLVGISMDISERKAIEESILQKQHMLHGIAVATDELLINPNLSEAINNSLIILGKAVGVDRVYLFENDYNQGDEVFTSQRFEWNSGDAAPQIYNPDLQVVPISIFDEFLPRLHKREPFKAIVSQLKEGSQIKEILVSQEIKSILIIPVFFNDEFWGFIGYDDCTKEREWSLNEVLLLKSFANSISSALGAAEAAQEMKNMALFPLENPNPVVRINREGEVLLKNRPAEILFQKNGLKVEKNIHQRLCNILTDENRIEVFEIEADSKYYSVVAKLSKTDEYINIYYNDITKLKKVEQDIISSHQQLRLQEEKYRNIISNMNLGFLEIDNNQVVQFCNQSFTEITGYSLDEIKKEKISNLKFLEAQRDFFDNVSKNSIDKIADGFEIFTRNKRGEPKWWLISYAPNFNDKGEGIGAICVFLDITEQKKLAIDLERALEESKVASKAKELFLTNMSHEIRTPLNGIIGMIRELKKGDFDQKNKNYIESASKASKHLLSIINNIIDIAKIEAGELKLDSHDFGVKNLLNDVHSILISQANDKMISFDIQTDDNVSEAYVGDEARIRQILINLAGNAIKFTNKGGVSISCIGLSKTAKKQQMKFVINDSGIGMDENYLSNPFEKFQQEDASISRNFGGTGLGLFITKQLVDLMGGTIQIDSKKGVGTVIEIILSLPIGEVFSIQEDEVAEFEQLNKNPKVLLVEDNELNQLVVEMILPILNCDLTTVDNGKKAVKLLEKEEFDIILMDIQMPVMNGIEATKIIREKLKLETPIIALSANAFKSEIDLCMSTGMNDYVTKPFEEQYLLQVITKYLKKKYSMKNSKESLVPNEPKDENLYDLSRLQQMSRGNAVFIKKMLNLFIDSFPKYNEEFRQAYEKLDIVGINKVAHKIKPSLNDMGISSLKQDILDLEIFPKENGSQEELEVLVNRVTTVLDKVVMQIKENESALL